MSEESNPPATPPQVPDPSPSDPQPPVPESPPVVPVSQPLEPVAPAPPALPSVTVQTAVASPAQVLPKPPPEPFVPKDLSYDGLMYFAAWLQDQGKITNEQFNYLHKTAQQYRRTQDELTRSYERMEAARRALDIPAPELAKVHSAPQEQRPSEAEQLVNLMTALAAAAQQPKQEEPKQSYLIKRGDQVEIEEMKAREEQARHASMTGAVGTVSAQPVSRPEMERQRRERYEALQKANEEAAKKREEAERRQRALDAMWKNDGTSSIGKQ